MKMSRKICWLLVILLGPIISAAGFGAAPGRLSKADGADNKAVGIMAEDDYCYDWGGLALPCDYSGPLAEYLLGGKSPNPRFTDNLNGTITDNLTGLIWLKNAGCFGRMDWAAAWRTVRNLEPGLCGQSSGLILNDGSSAGDWRVPTLMELASLIDSSQRHPALPPGHGFIGTPGGYYWSATRLGSFTGLAYVVYMDVGVVCYNQVTDRAGYVWPVRGQWRRAPEFPLK